MIFDITFECEKGQYKIEDCKRFPRQKDIEGSARNLDGIGIGKLKQIIIDITGI